MKLSIRRFGSAEREMVGVHRRPNQPDAGRPAFLMCRPLGQEAIRASAMYRALAERLVREGCDCLCFDYHGTGDSPGNEEPQTLAAWVQDTLAAHEELLRDAPSRPVHWFGLAMGANIALRAAARARVAPHHVVAWQPILNGDTYMQALLDAHRHELARELRLNWHQIIERGLETEPQLPGVALGFGFGEALVAELRALKQLPLAPTQRRGVRVSCGIPDDQRAALAADDLQQVMLLDVEDRTNWMSTEAIGTALVPQDVTRALLATLAVTHA
jgi:uncharacterized protein